MSEVKKGKSSWYMEIFGFQINAHLKIDDLNFNLLKGGFRK